MVGSTTGLIGGFFASNMASSHISRTSRRTAQVWRSLNGLDLKAVRVERYADAIDGADPLRQERICTPAPSDADFCLPPLPKGSRWHLAVDTSRSVRQDFVVTGAGTLMDHSKPYHLQERSSAIALAARDSSSTPS